jgi:predicted unusual protein kinase regulating ubiquinone biosynthesis (AarF/ABC1/UbiB family)
VTRSAKLAALPVGFAGRTALGFGRRVGGRPAEIVAAEIQARTAEQLFKVLGELKGGAMKFGQALSVAEAALPEHLAAPYRATLTKLQEAAPPLPPKTVHKVLAVELGRSWRRKFTSFEDVPAAAASIGQVHRAVWKDGRAVAVKIQYPGAGEALLGDLRQIARLARMFGALVPGLDIKPLLAELEQRVAEELDYDLEAEAQTQFAKVYWDDPDIAVPAVVMNSAHVLVTEWIDGTPLSKIISGGSPDQRDRCGVLLVRLMVGGPQRVGMLHADPHPGNYRLLDDGRLGVLDFGAVNRLPDGLPPAIGRLLGVALDGDADELHDGLRAEGFIKPRLKVDSRALLDYLLPFLEPLTIDRFRFDRPWLRAQATRVSDPRTPGYALGLQLNLPPQYLLIHRVWLGGIGVLCQLGSEADWREEFASLLPGLSAGAPLDGS